MSDELRIPVQEIKSSSKRGGARPGAGRPRKTVLLAGAPVAQLPIAEQGSPGAFLLALLRDESIETKLRIDAAKALLPFWHVRAEPLRKPAASDEAARTAQAGTSWDGLIQ
jgi:phage terminase small subunit